MPSTNKTPNLGLNQWTRTDHITTGDFNSDNTKIDTAIVNINNSLGGKVDKENGKGLSSNDYTNAEKSKLAALPADVYAKQETKNKFANALYKSLSGTTVSLVDAQCGTELVTCDISGKTIESPKKLIPSDQLKFEGDKWIAGKNVSAITRTQDQGVVEWGTSEATRIQTSGGTSNLKYYFTGGKASDITCKYQSKVRVKNIGQNTIIISGAYAIKSRSLSAVSE